MTSGHCQQRWGVGVGRAEVRAAYSLRDLGHASQAPRASGSPALQGGRSQEILDTEVQLLLSRNLLWDVYEFRSVRTSRQQAGDPGV